MSLTELPLASIWAWLGIGEMPSGYMLIGGAIIIISITYQALSGTRRRLPPYEPPWRGNTSARPATPPTAP